MVLLLLNKLFCVVDKNRTPYLSSSSSFSYLNPYLCYLCSRTSTDRLHRTILPRKIRIAIDLIRTRNAIAQIRTRIDTVLIRNDRTKIRIGIDPTKISIDPIRTNTALIRTRTEIRTSIDHLTGKISIDHPMAKIRTANRIPRRRLPKIRIDTHPRRKVAISIRLLPRTTEISIPPQVTIVLIRTAIRLRIGTAIRNMNGGKGRIARSGKNSRKKNR